MFDWILVYIVVFFFVGLFQFMVNFFEPPDKKVSKTSEKKLFENEDKKKSTPATREDS